MTLSQQRTELLRLIDAAYEQGMLDLAAKLLGHYIATLGSPACASYDHNGNIIRSGS